MEQTTKEVRIGNQVPTTSVILPYTETKGREAIDLYNKTKRKAREWQEIMTYDILATNEDGLWTHTKFGFEIPRRNGKGEILTIRELYALQHGETVLHTAHRTPTSHSAWERLCMLLDQLGVEYKSTKQFGLETVKILETGACVNFRTRSSVGGLGEGYDLLIIDEAQEYTTDQESSLKYVVSASPNPQTLFCGTPPTAVSAGTVFLHMRERVYDGVAKNTGWAEWSVPYKSDPNDKELWYMCNPSLGQGLSERAIEDEITSDDIDFNIQRFGLWLTYNQKSAISRTEWEALQVASTPDLEGKLFVGIKYGHDGENVALSVACKTTDGNVFVEGIDCRKITDGNTWIIDFLAKANVKKVAVDGQNGQQILVDDLRDYRVKVDTCLPKVRDIIAANQMFEIALNKKTITHGDQPSMTQSVSNCEKRPIGSNGGFGYRSIKQGVDVSLVDSVILAHWLCLTQKAKKKQTASY